MPETLTRIAVFYDGDFFYHVSNYYTYKHPRRSRISISGLHRFIRKKVAEFEGVEERFTQLVDLHYFRGRLSAQEAQERDLLYKERLFDDVLVREGVTTHYLPGGGPGDRSLNVWLALDAYELALHKHFDVVVLLASGSDYVPLARKLNTLGTRIMVLGWDFEFIDEGGQSRVTRTSQVLLEVVTYPILMNQLIDDRSQREKGDIDRLFVPRREPTVPSQAGPSARRGNGEKTSGEPEAPMAVPEGEEEQGVIQNIKDGYGFITPDTGGENIFFFYREVVGCDFNDLEIGERVTFRRGTNDRGECALDVQLVEED